MRRILIAIACSLGGLIAGALITFFGGLALGEIANISQAEGAYAMGLAFFWAPIGAFIGAGIGLWLALRRWICAGRAQTFPSKSRWMIFASQ